MTADATRAGTPAVRVRDLVVSRRGRPVLHGLSLDIGRGLVTGLLGPSGSGKTTLMRCIVGVQVVASGTVEVLDLPAGSAALRTRVAYLTQAPSVYRDLTVQENLRYFARLLRTGDAEVARVIATVDLGVYRDTQAERLSGGELVRLSLAIALLKSPDVLVLDEPTVGLDPVLRRDLWRTFHALAAAGTTLLVSSHVMEEAAQCDDIALMRSGALLARGAPAALLAETGANDIGEAFLRLIDARPPA